MYIIGLDFDNTIVCYDGVFQKVAIETNIVPKQFAISKNKIRDYLRKIDKENIWTELQGYIYGKCMMDAKLFPGVVDFFELLNALNIAVYIISHRTRYPFLGPRYDLILAARDWLIKQKLNNSNKLILSPENIFFELTKAEKIQRIIDLGCTHYLDDLPEILEMLPPHVEKILFSPDKKPQIPDDWKLIQSWHELPSLINIA